MSWLKIDRRLARLMIPFVSVFLVMVVLIVGAMFQWQHRQDERGMLQAHNIIDKTLANVIDAGVQEMTFLGEAITRNKDYLKTCKCFVKSLDGKSIKRCAKKTLGPESEQVSEGKLSDLFREVISSNANGTNNYFIAKNPDIEIFDVVYKGKVIWSLSEKNYQNKAIESSLLMTAREEKKSVFGVEKGPDDHFYLFGYFAHFNAGEYYFTRIGVNFEQIIRRMIEASDADFVSYEGRIIFANEEVEASAQFSAKDFDTGFDGSVDAQEDYFVYRVALPTMQGDGDSNSFYLVKNGKEQIQRASRDLLLMVIGICLLLVFSMVVVLVSMERSLVRPIISMLKDLSDSSHQMDASSKQVAETSSAVAAGASEQSASLAATSESLNRISSSTSKSSQDSTQADSHMQEASALVQRASESMDSLVGLSDAISADTEDIQSIINTIDEIAFQTNLLALNASVEAARAGDAGRGFAVVADEVGNLAKRSALAVETTSALIEGTVLKVSKISKLGNLTKEEFSEMQESTRIVGELVGDVSSASEEQAISIESISTTVIELDKATQGNAASAEELAAASQHLLQEVAAINVAVDKMKSIIGD